MPITKSVSAKARFSYTQLLHPNKEPRPMLRRLKETKEFEIFTDTTYLMDCPDQDQVEKSINCLLQGCEEALELFNKLGKVSDDLRLDIWVTQEAYDKDSYKEVSTPRTSSFWLTKSYVPHKEVSVRRGLSTGMGSVNPEGGDGFLEYSGKELKKVFQKETTLLALKAREYLEDVLVKSFQD